MPISPREFFNTKALIVEYQTLEISHPAFGVRRWVANQYVDITLGGIVYEPASMKIKETIQDARNSISYEVQLGIVGSHAKQLIKLIDAYPLGWVIPIIATVKYWLSSDTSTPYRIPVVLSVGNLAIDGEAVAMTLDTANPRGQSVARRYNGIDFPGTNAKV